MPNDLTTAEVANIFGNTWVFEKDFIPWTCGTKRKLMVFLRRSHYRIEDATDFTEAEIKSAFDMAQVVTKRLDIENVISYYI